MPYKVLPHTADVKIKVTAKNLEELFSEAILAMFNIMKPTFSSRAKKVKRKIKMSSFDRDSLLVDVLSAVLTSADVNNEAYKEAKVSFPRQWEANVELIGASVSSYKEDEIKAVTYHGLKIVETESGFEVEIIFDI